MDLVGELSVFLRADENLVKERRANENYGAEHDRGVRIDAGNGRRQEQHNACSGRKLDKGDQKTTR